MITDDTQPLTKADGRHILELLAKLHDDMTDMRQEMTGVHEETTSLRQEIVAMEKRLLGHINFLDERNRKDYFDMLEIRYDQHDTRITKLEQYTGIAA